MPQAQHCEFIAVLQVRQAPQDGGDSPFVGTDSAEVHAEKIGGDHSHSETINPVMISEVCVRTQISRAATLAKASLSMIGSPRGRARVNTYMCLHSTDVTERHGT